MFAALQDSLKLTLFTVLVTNICLSHAKSGAEISQTGQPQQQQQGWQSHGPITALPGYAGKLRSKHYGGYISVGSKQLYYYMAESERSPVTDPVV